MSAPTAAPPARTGCYKCGQQGHWSRDCPVPREQWIQQQPGKAAPAPAAADEENDPTAINASTAPVDPPPKLRRKRPKLDADHILSAKGLPEVYGTFYDVFMQQFKGPGHEAGDLRRLLELYTRWHDRFYPYVTFDSFTSTIEKVGNTRTIAHHLTTLRQSVYTSAQRQADELRGIVPPSAQDDEEQAGGIPAPAHLDADDELMELAAMDPAGTTRHTDVPDDDDELEALMRLPVTDVTPDDELEAMAAAQPMAVSVGQAGAAGDQAVGGGGPGRLDTALGDDDMQELAGTQLAGAAGTGTQLGDDDMQELAGTEPVGVAYGAAGPHEQGMAVAEEEVDELEALLDMPPA